MTTNNVGADSYRTIAEVIAAGLAEIARPRSGMQFLNDDRRRSGRGCGRDRSRHAAPIGLEATQFPILVMPSQHSQDLR